MLLTEAEIASLLRQESITDELPWNTGDERAIDSSIAETIAEVRRTHRLQDQTEFGHYGSGYASFVDCWLYRNELAFKYDSGDCYWGLVVLFSRLSNYYVLGEGQKTWHEKSSASYMPSFEFVDKLLHPAVISIADDVCAVLDRRGFVRAHAANLSELLPASTEVPTILCDPPYRHFDALFHWED